MPPKLYSKVESAVSEYNYSSISEFIRDAIRAWEDDRLARELRESQKEARLGKVKLLRSLKDLR